VMWKGWLVLNPQAARLVYLAALLLVAPATMRQLTVVVLRRSRRTVGGRQQP
jgi:hypothetical protein